MNGTQPRTNKPHSTGDVQGHAPNGTTASHKFTNNTSNNYPKRSGNNVHKDVNNNGTNQVNPTSTSAPTTINPNLLYPLNPALAIPTINPNLTSNSPPPPILAPAPNGINHNVPSGSYRGRGGHRGRGSGRGRMISSYFLGVM